ncbi:MAG TPA: glycosyltransferase family 4 protein [Flavisolibacter sp.]|nr:glycosyltransferase family 4 protein [Flavisolibacter sp.]
MGSPKKLLFLTLNTFSSTGGIEKVCRVAGKALHQIAEEVGGHFEHYALYDEPAQVIENYIPKTVFRPFSGNRFAFLKKAISAGRKTDVILLSHVHLLAVGFAIKMLSPRTKVVLLAHGIEVWKPFSSWKVRMLKALDLVLPVSQFTQQKMQALYGLAPKKFGVLNNCLDPFLAPTESAERVAALRKKHGLTKEDIVLFTLTRLKSSEQYKGYDKVIAALPPVLQKYPAVKYLVAGKYDAEERKRLDVMIEELGLQDKVIFTGFIGDDEVAAYFTLPDVYVMPSTGEGFGIVFIEALFYGKPVIAGNVDGSVDALAGGQFGLLVNPAKKDEIVSALLEVLAKKNNYVPDGEAVQARFGFGPYVSRLKTLVFEQDLRKSAEEGTLTGHRSSLTNRVA